MQLLQSPANFKFMGEARAPQSLSFVALSIGLSQELFTLQQILVSLGPQKLISIFGRLRASLRILRDMCLEKEGASLGALKA